MDNFWIGDLVVDEKTGLEGKFEGKNAQNQVRLNTRGKIILLGNPKLRAMTVPEQDAYSEAMAMDLPKVTSKSTEVKTYTNTIDLHIEKLAPSMITKRLEAILHRQLSATKQFIEESISKRQHQILIIHGKGTGALKMEIDMLLHNYPEIHHWNEVNNGGATMVFLKYPVSWQVSI